MHKFIVMGLIGEEEFTEMLIGLPDEFYKFQETEQDAVWKAVLGKFNEGSKDTGELIRFATNWIKLYTLHCVIC